MNTDASSHLTDIKIRRLKDFQEAVNREFSKQVKRHKAEIEERTAHFKEKFPVIARDHVPVLKFR